jgi:hypothetical protein
MASISFYVIFNFSYKKEASCENKILEMMYKRVSTFKRNDAVTQRIELTVITFEVFTLC